MTCGYTSCWSTQRIQRERNWRSPLAGHSKWANIKHRKGRQDKKRGIMFSKLSRAITVAAKESDAALAQAVQAAKDASMPKDNIERAIAKGKGAGEGDAYENVVYEG